MTLDAMPCRYADAIRRAFVTLMMLSRHAYDEIRAC